MSSLEKSFSTELDTLADEVMDLWREYLAVCAASGGDAQPEAMKLPEPFRAKVH